MTLNYGKKEFNNEELEWAISLMEKEYPKKDRDNPSKMAELISKSFDVHCTAFQVIRFFDEISENYEKESLTIENYGQEQSLDS